MAKLARVYAIDGEERALVDDLVRSIKSEAVPDHARDFNQDIFSGKDTAPARIVEAAQTLPAFAPQRLVVVTQAEQLKASMLDELIAYVTDPSPTTVLVLVAQKFDGRSKLYKAIKKHQKAVRFSAPRLKEMPMIVKKRARAMGVAIENTAIPALVDAVGADIQGVQHALELLVLYIGPNEPRPITQRDVETVVASTREESIFDLVDAIGLGDQGGVLQKLHVMLTVSREPPLRVLAMIARHYRNMIKAKEGLLRGAEKREIQAITGLPDFPLRKVLEQARRQPLDALIEGLGAIRRTDRALKGGALNNVRAMERLTISLMRVSC